MKANRSKDTRPEVALRKALWHAGHRGYRLHYKKMPGRPDIAFVSKKVAIFVHGCFWHRCQSCNYRLPKVNTEFWKKKFDSNVARDRKNLNQLEAFGWTVITVWECSINSDLGRAVNLIIPELQ